MDHFDVDDLLEAHDETDGPYLEFLRESSLSVGLYRLPSGAADPQEPHSEDEVYYVLSGRARIRVADETRPVEPGSVVFVKREVDHEFVDVEEELVVLVFFAPAEGSLAGANGNPGS